MNTTTTATTKNRLAKKVAIGAATIVMTLSAAAGPAFANHNNGNGNKNGHDGNGKANGHQKQDDRDGSGETVCTYQPPVTDENGITTPGYSLCTTS